MQWYFRTLPGSLQRPSRFLRRSLFPRVYRDTRTQCAAHTHAVHTSAVFGPPSDGYRELYTDEFSGYHAHPLHIVAYLHNIDVSNRSAARGPSADALALPWNFIVNPASGYMNCTRITATCSVLRARYAVCALRLSRSGSGDDLTPVVLYSRHIR